MDFILVANAPDDGRIDDAHRADGSRRSEFRVNSHEFDEARNPVAVVNSSALGAASAASCFQHLIKPRTKRFVTRSVGDFRRQFQGI